MNKIHHTAIICYNYKISKKFYTHVLGLEIIREVYRQERQSYKLDLALNGDYIIELFSFPNPPNRPSRPEACGLRHLAFVNLSVCKRLICILLQIPKYENSTITPSIDHCYGPCTEHHIL